MSYNWQEEGTKYLDKNDKSLHKKVLLSGSPLSNEII